MKLRLHWAEKYEVIREYPSFDLDSEQFPELELEMLQVYNAGSSTERANALDTLEYKMQHTTPADRGETIFQIVGPHNGFAEAQTYPLTEEAGALIVTPEEE
jgi:hypothetical protein